jgi:hypothetical protein
VGRASTYSSYYRSGVCRGLDVAIVSIKGRISSWDEGKVPRGEEWALWLGGGLRLTSREGDGRLAGRYEGF